MHFSWSRYGGYECSSAGDKRFSAFFAKLKDGRTIEEHYQCDLKGYDPGGRNWKLGKGKPPKYPHTAEKMQAWYVLLWREWAEAHPSEIAELRAKATACGGILSDRFATSDINQASALADILNGNMSAPESRPPQANEAKPERFNGPTSTEPVIEKISPEEAYNSLIDHLSAIDGHSEAYLEFHAKHKALFLDMPASVNSHHSWPGGYAVHIAEVVSNAVKLAPSSLVPARKRPSMAEVIISAYVHDLDKLFMRYIRDTDGPTEPQRKKAMHEGIKIDADETKASLSKKIDAAVNGKPIPGRLELPRHVYNPNFPAVEDSGAVRHLCAEHNLPGITWDVMHAITFHHGGWAYMARCNNHVRLSPLAILLHAADQLSAGVQVGDAD